MAAVFKPVVDGPVMKPADFLDDRQSQSAAAVIC